MIFNVLTLFPEMFDGILSSSILKRAIEKDIIKVDIFNIRDFSNDRHKNVDDYPYGGGYGMVMMAQPIFDAVEYLKNGFNIPVYYMSPKGKVFNHDMAMRIAKLDRLILLCGHYEGIDERVYSIIDEEISIGDFVMTGGEIAAMAVIDAISRLIPGVLSHPESYQDESFYGGLLEYPQYTRPEEFRGMKVPDVLLSGNHAEISKWRRQKSLEITMLKRPDIIKRELLTDEDIKFLRYRGFNI